MASGGIAPPELPFSHYIRMIGSSCKRFGPGDSSIKMMSRHVSICPEFYITVINSFLSDVIGERRKAEVIRTGLFIIIATSCDT